MNPPEMAHVATCTFAVSAPGLARYGLAPADTGNSKPHRTINVSSRAGTQNQTMGNFVLSWERFFMLFILRVSSPHRKAEIRVTGLPEPFIAEKSSDQRRYSGFGVALST